MLASTMWFPMDGRDQPHARLAGVSVGPPTTHRTCYGGHSERETPGHIPNPEAKTLSADGTAGETPWESRTPPDNSQTRPSSHRRWPRRISPSQEGSGVADDDDRTPDRPPGEQPDRPRNEHRSSRPRDAARGDR